MLSYSVDCFQAFDSLSTKSGSVTMVTPEFWDLWNLLSSDLMACMRGAAGSAVFVEVGGGGLRSEKS